MRTGGGEGEALSRDTRRLQSQPDESERPALWDPANAWPSGRRLIWALPATWVGVSAARGDRRGRVEGLSSFEAGLLRRHG